MLASVIFAFVGQGTGMPRPTGRNGYEEYMQAAELLKGAGLIVTWQPGMKPPVRDPDDPDDNGPSPKVVAEYARLNAMTPLEVRREALRRYGKALTLIAQGNTKPVFDPRASIDPMTSFPELATFRSLSRFASAAVSVYAADGRTDMATKTLTDQIAFADNIGRGVIITNLVGVAITAIAIRGFEDLLPRMSYADTLRLKSSIESVLARPSAMIDSMVAEERFNRAAIQPIFTQKVDPKVLMGTGDDEEEPDPTSKRMQAEFLRLTPAGKQALARSVEMRLRERTNRIVRTLKGPEKSWLPFFAEEDELATGKPDSLADYLAGMVVAGISSQLVQTTVRSRTQLRLLSLYAGASAYRWEHGKWPTKVHTVDPLTGEPFVYEVRDDGTIRIASKGTKETGEIELRYKAPKPAEEVRP